MTSQQLVAFPSKSVQGSCRASALSCLSQPWQKCGLLPAVGGTMGSRFSRVPAHDALPNVVFLHKPSSPPPHFPPSRPCAGPCHVALPAQAADCTQHGATKKIVLSAPVAENTTLLRRDDRTYCRVRAAVDSRLRERVSGRRRRNDAANATGRGGLGGDGFDRLLPVGRRRLGVEKRCPTGRGRRRIPGHARAQSGSGDEQPAWHILYDGGGATKAATTSILRGPETRHWAKGGGGGRRGGRRGGC